MWEAFIEYNLYPTYVFELIALLAGFFYYFQNPEISKAEKLFVFTMLFVFIFSATSLFYGMYTYFHGYKNIQFLKDTPFEKNYWITNIRVFIMFPAYTLYFAWNLRNIFWRKILYLLISLFIVSSIISFFLSDNFFTASSNFVYFSGTFLLSFGAALGCIEIMASNRILNFRNELVFYIAFGILLFYLSYTPLSLMRKYVPGNNDFREIYATILGILNFIMYGIFSAGFLIKSFQLGKAKRGVQKL